MNGVVGRKMMNGELIKKKTDFRGPQGVWTLKAKGQMAKAKNLTQAYPTYSHYAITELVKRKLVKFIVTTNMDSLHLRTGLPKHFISEQHGNWFSILPSFFHYIYHHLHLIIH